MTVFAVYSRAHDKNGPEARALPERFSWFAFLLPPVWALVHGLWLALAGWVIFLVGLNALAERIGSDTPFALYVLGALWTGFEASALRGAALRRGGWTSAGDAVASGPDLAELEWARRQAETKAE
ncbi:MAG TPA: DUF2628 domain-containing protein [Devosiaceae bacterium]